MMMDSSVAIDVESLMPFVAARNKDSSANTRTLSRKVSHRGEMQAAVGNIKNAEESTMAVGARPLGKGLPDVQLAAEQEPSQTPTGGRHRKFGSRNSQWLDSRRVMFFFATLSSMGSLILLYFTFSMAKTQVSDANTR